MMRSLLVGGIGLCFFAACSASDSAGSGGTSAGGSSASGGSSATGGSSGTIGVGGSSASGGGGTGATCAADSYDGQLVPLDMFVMLDRSGSMADGGKWSAVTSALNTFVGLPGLTGLGMGLAFFPVPPNPPPPPTCQTNEQCGPSGLCLLPFGVCLGDSCEPTDYAKPVVAIAPLPGVGSAITSAIGGTSPNGDTTPTRPALQGAMTYAIDWAAKHTDHITIVVLATDGEPTGCMPNSISDSSAVATQGLNSNPSVKTFVIGVGSQLSSLNAIAQAGGTGQATIVSAGNAAQEFLDALNAIRGSIGCTYEIPIGPDGTTDFSKVNVAFTPDGGTTENFPQVGSAADCVGTKAWYYDNPSSPTQIILCPAACDLVTNSKGKVDVLLGCPTIVH